MYWTLKSIPELRPLLPSERKRLWRAAGRDRLRAADLPTLLLILAGAAAIVLTERAVEAAAGKEWARVVFFAMLVGFYPLYAFPVLAWRSRPTLRRLIDQRA